MDESDLLLDQRTLAARADAGDLPPWAFDHWSTFRESLLGDRDGAPFPCYFGVESVRAGDPLYALCSSPTDKDALFDLRDALLAYLDVYEDHAEQTSLVVFFGPDDAEREADYHERLWHVLQFLHVHDPVPWPADIPTDPDDPYWEFCFGGEPVFPTCRAPFYDTYASRHSPAGLEITFQPRTLFEGITADTDAGQAARETIHDRLEAYDGVCPHADIGDWGVEGDREWIQYMLREDDAQAPETCPIEVTREHPKAAVPEDAR